MKFKKGMLFVLFLLTILTIGAVSASDEIISDDLSVNLNDADFNESSINEDVLSIDENEEVIAVEQNNGDELSKAIDETVGAEEDNAVLGENINVTSSLAAQNSEDVLSDGEIKKVKINFYKQTGKYANDKKVYANLIDANTNKTLSIDDFGSNIENFRVLVSLYDANTNEYEAEAYIFKSGSDDKIFVLDWSSKDLGVGNFIIKNPVLMFDGGRYNLVAEGETKVTVYKNNLKITANSISVPLNSKKKFTIKVTDSDNKPAANARIIVEIITSGEYTSKYLATNSKGIINLGVSDLSVGKHKVVISVDPEDKGYMPGLYEKSVTSYITVSKIPIKIKASKLSTTYKSGKYFKVKITNSKTKKAVKGIKVILKVYTGKKAKTVTLTSNSNGIVKYSSSKLKVGKHKVVLKVKTNKNIKGSSKTSSIKVSKAALKIVAPSKINNYKKAGKFTATIKNKVSGKAVKGIKVTMKVYTGKKYKTYTVKTNGKGKASFSTKSLGKGKHKIVVTAKGNSNFKKASKKSSVTIVKNRISTRISTNHKFMYMSDLDGQPLVGYGEFHLYAGGKELKNKEIKVYHGSEYVTTIKSGVTSFIEAIHGTLTFKYAGSVKYEPCSYDTVLF